MTSGPAQYEPAVRKLSKNCQGQQPADSMRSVRSGRISGRQINETSRQSAAGTIHAEAGSAQTRLGERKVRKQSQGHSLIASNGHRKSQDNDYRSDPQVAAMMLALPVDSSCK